MTSGLILPTPAGGAAALSATLLWIDATEGSDAPFSPSLKPLDGSGGSESLAEALTVAGLPTWRDAIERAARQDQPLGPDPALAWLMAHAALEVAAAANRPGLFYAVDELQTLGNVSDAELSAAICARIGERADAYQLLARLQTRLQDLWNSRFNDRIRQYAEATVGKPLTTRDLWPRHDGMPMGDGWAHRTAAVLWPERYMALLTGLPSAAQSGLAGPLEPLDIGLVASLIKACPLIFSDDGTPLGPVVPFVLLGASERWLAAIAVENEPGAKADAARLLNAVLARDDGPWLGRAWLQQVIWRDTARRAGRPEVEVDAERAVRDALLTALSTRLAPLGAMSFDWIRKEEPLWAVHRILAEASILEAHDDPEAAAEVLASGVRQGLVTATGRANGMASQSPESMVVGRVLSHVSDLSQWLAALWSDTYEVREALSYPAQRSLDNPAYPTLSWALNGLNASPRPAGDRAKLWRLIADAVFETQRIDPNAYLFNGAMLPIVRVTAQLGAAFAEAGIVPVDDLARFLADQLEPSIEHARLWQIMRSEASDVLTLQVGRKVGAALLREAIETALAEKKSSWEVAMNVSAEVDLADFAARL